MHIHRLSYSDDVHKVGIKAFEETVTAELENRTYATRQVMERTKPLVAKDEAQTRTDSTFALLKEQELLKFNRSREETTSLQQDRLSTLSLTTHGGLSVSTPPYDMFWVSNAFWDKADNVAGTFKVYTIDQLGYQAAGVGLFVSSTINQRVRFSADARFHSQWTNLIAPGGNLGFGAASSEGGVGVLVYEGGNLVARSDARLWSDYQSGNTLHGNSGDSVTNLNQTSAGQTYFHMVAGRQYQVWVWAWATVHFYGEALAIAIIDAAVPFVVIQQA